MTTPAKSTLCLPFDQCYNQLKSLPGGNTLALTRAEVEHLAKLARLGLSDEDETKFEQQLSVILEHFDVLRQLDTEGVPPTAHTLPLENVFSPDEPRPSLPPEEVLANAPRAEDGLFRVRAVLE